MIIWLINFFFSYGLSFSSSSFFFSSIRDFGIGEYNDVHVKVNKKERLKMNVILFDMSDLVWNGGVRVRVCSLYLCCCLKIRK